MWWRRLAPSDGERIMDHCWALTTFQLSTQTYLLIHSCWWLWVVKTWHWTSSLERKKGTDRERVCQSWVTCSPYKTQRQHPDHIPILSYTSFYVTQVTAAFCDIRLDLFSHPAFMTEVATDHSCVVLLTCMCVCVCLSDNSVCFHNERWRQIVHCH